MRTAGFVFAGAEKIYSACIFFAGRFLFYIIQKKSFGRHHGLSCLCEHQPPKPFGAQQNWTQPALKRGRNHRPLQPPRLGQPPRKGRSAAPGDLLLGLCPVQPAMAVGGQRFDGHLRRLEGMDMPLPVTVVSSSRCHRDAAFLFRRTTLRFQLQSGYGAKRIRFKFRRVQSLVQQRANFAAQPIWF
jgi:hypothetical protein